MASSDSTDKTRKIVENTLNGRPAAGGDVEPLVRMGRIDEAGLSRLISHTKMRGFAIMTAFRDKYDVKENRVRNHRLLSQLKSSRMGPIMLDGHWQEDPEGVDYETAKKEGRLIDVSEESFFVPQPDSMEFEQFEDIVSSLGFSGFDQDAIIIGNSEDGAWLKFKGGGTKKLGKLSINRAADAYSKMRKRNKNIPFVFEGTERPSNWIVASAFHKCGLNWFGG